MIFDNNLVYFEDNDTVEDIQIYFSKLIEQQNKLDKKSYGVKIEKDNKTISLEMILQAMEKIDFKEKKSKLTIINLLKSEINCLNDDFENLYDKHFYSFFALLDFIQRKKISHSFEYDAFYDSEINYWHGSFKGVFKKELESIEDVMSIAPIAFHVEDNTKRKKEKDLPCLLPASSFDEVTKKIKRYFISNMESNEYSKLLLSYKKFAQKIK